VLCLCRTFRRRCARLVLCSIKLSTSSSEFMLVSAAHRTVRTAS
jgi:hypothetical protein